MVSLTLELLVHAVGCTPALAARFAEPLRVACAFYGIDTPKRLAAFLAQVGHESASFRFVRELADGSAYDTGELARRLGNTPEDDDDGEKYRGHGLIQITGHANHVRVRDRLRARFPNVPDFETDPEALMDPQWAALSAADYWDEHGLNALADAGDFKAITRKINGGLNGLPDRLQRWERAKQALQAAATDASAPLPNPLPRETAKEAASPSPATTENPMLPALFLPLAAAVIDIFTPLAKEKINKEMARHSDNPQVIEQISSGVIDAVKVATGVSEPIAAVAALQSNPNLVPQVEDQTLENLSKMAPLLDKLAEFDQQVWTAEEASREAAAKRAKEEEYDMTKLLIGGAFAIFGVLLLILSSVIGVQLWKTGKVDTEVWAQFAGIIGAALGIVGTIYTYRFGSSRSSSAKDVVIGELTRRSK